MSRCRHRNARLYEEHNGESVWDFEDGRLADWEGVSRSGHPTGVLFVHCQDCGYGKRFRLATAPNWVRAMYRQVTDE